ncbi:MAG: ferric reductase-like transmembrane domain-containing protein [Bacteroidales bacterium]
MKYTYKRGFYWLFVYFILVLIPLAIALSGTIPSHRGFWLELGVSFGFIGFGMLCLQFLFSGRFKKIAPTYGMDNLLQYHREIGILAFLFIVAHPVIIILADYEFISYLDPRVNAIRAIALVFVTIAVILVIITSIWRTAMSLEYEKWRLLHGLLSLSVIFIGAVHSIQVSHYLDPLWKKSAIGLSFIFYGYLILHTRITRPWLMRKKPYKVTDVIPELGDSWTIKIRPDGHKRLKYICGQFVWLTIKKTPFSLQQHPFSIASSTRDKELSFTAKASGDFTSTWKDIKPGTKVFLEGPYGSFVPERGKNLFFIMGGIGITPAMAMLRTMRDNNDPRRAVLIYGNVTWEDITFREELEELSMEINLKLVHLLEKPPGDWEGERGLVSGELLQKYLPSEPEDFMYFICGPKPLMDISELLLRDMGIDWRLIYTERFEII